jgi:hypothetical protein
MQAKRAAYLVLATALLATPLPAAARAGEISWGRPGVSIDTYSADATACVNKAVNLDITDTEAVQRLIQASRALATIETNMDILSHARMRDGYRPDRQFEAIKSLQQTTLDACLAERGYRQFRLTDAQLRQLRRLEQGSAERRAFLHRLAADPEVLRRQALDQPPLQPTQG